MKNRKPHPLFFTALAIALPVAGQRLIDIAVNMDIIQKSGAWYSYNNMRIGQGKEKARDYLKENPQVCKEVEKKVRDLTINKVVSESAGAPEDAVAETKEEPDDK